MKTGWGQCDITPTGGAISLDGQWEERVTDFVRDPIQSTAVVMQQGDRRAIWVSCDLVSNTRGLVREVKRRLRASLPGFADEQLTLCVTHDHTGPVTDTDAFLTLSDRPEATGALTAAACRYQIADAIERMVLEAASRLEDTAFEVACAPLMTGVNRRVRYADGAAEMYGDLRRADFAGMEGRDGGPIQLLVARRARDRSLLGVIANAPCPAQCDEAALYVSGDYWGYARAMLKDAYGEDCRLLPLLRSAGDLSPHAMVDCAPGFPRGWNAEGASRLGRAVGQAILDAVRAPLLELPAEPCFRAECLRTTLPLWLPSPELIAQSRELLKRPLPSEDFDALVERATAIAAVRRADYGDSRYPATLYATRIDSVVLLSNPFELYIEYADRIRMACPEAILLDAELSGDEELGYLPTKRAIEGGGYSAQMFTCVCNDEGGDELVRKSIGLVRSIFA